MATIAIDSESGLVEAVRAARADGRRLEIIGAGSKRGLGRPVIADDLLDLSALSGIVSYEPEELVLTARAGTRLSEIEALIAERRQRLGFEPADWGPLFDAPASSGTIGGAIAADASGTARLRFGAARDHLLGFRAVNGLGEAYKGGGRVVKNVTGFDLPKLMCGGFGTLGPLSEVTVKLVPAPTLVHVMVVRGIGPDMALGLLGDLWRGPLDAGGLLYIPAVALEAFPPIGNPVAGAALIRLEGGAQTLAEKRLHLHTQLGTCAVTELADGADIFRHAAEGAIFAASDLDVWRLSVPPSASVEVARALAGTLWYADWAGALFWVGTSGVTQAAQVQLQRIAGRAGGRLHLMRAREAARSELAVFPDPGEGAMAMMRAVKAAFDPDGLFNPGRMFEGL